MTHPPAALTTLVQSFECECKCICVLLPASSPTSCLALTSSHIEPQLPQVTCSLSSPSLHILFLCLERMPISFPTCPCGNMRVSAKNRGVPYKQQQTLSGQTPTGGTRAWTPPPAPDTGAGYHTRLLHTVHHHFALLGLPLLHGLSKLPFSLLFSRDRLTQRRHP